MKELFTTDGRIPRSTFWKFFGCLYALCLVVGFLSESKVIPEAVMPIFGLVLLPVLFVGIIVQVKRWHDRDKSGWWILINFIPIFGALWSFVECGFVRGTDGANQYGPDPLQR